MNEHVSAWWFRLTPEWVPLMIGAKFLQYVQEAYFKSGTEKAADFEWFLDCPTLARVRNTEENVMVLRAAFTEYFNYQMLMSTEKLEAYLLGMRENIEKFVHSVMEAKS